jgi:hypothetical protein
MAAEQRVRGGEGRVLGVEVLGAMTSTRSQVVAELAHTPLQFRTSLPPLLGSSIPTTHRVYSSLV